MEKKRIGVGIIGCGAVSKAHVKAYIELHKECSIKVVADINRMQATMLANEVPNPVDVYDDIKSLLEREDIDLVSICTPPFLHKDQVILAFSYGKHVICEKPFAPSLADCDEMIEAARHYNRKLCITLQLRFGRDINRVKHIVKSGILGEIVFAQVIGLYWRGDSYYKKDWRGSWEKEGGGVLMTQAIHPLDLLLDILGPVKKVQAQMDTLSHQVEVEDYITATIEFVNGVKAHLLSTLCTVENELKIRISGKTKAVNWPLSYHAVQETASGFPTVDHFEEELLHEIAQEITNGRDDHYAPISDMVWAIRENREPTINGREARKSIEVVTGIYKSATTHKPVEFPIDKNDPWYTSQGIMKNVKRNQLK
jgi:UDP-N-acetyl-2-amino-2-deoxyglucuronate dehydrogenase